MNSRSEFNKLLITVNAALWSLEKRSGGKKPTFKLKPASWGPETKKPQKAWLHSWFPHSQAPRAVTSHKSSKTAYDLGSSYPAYFWFPIMKDGWKMKISRWEVFLGQVVFGSGWSNQVWGLAQIAHSWITSLCVVRTYRSSPFPLT